jgi:hypothetical protein
MSSAKNSIDNPNMTMDIDSMINECDSESSRPLPPGVSLKKKELPDKKTVVLMFAKQLEDREKHVSGAKGTVIKLHHCISCPMNDQCKEVKNEYDPPHYLWQKGSGYSNLFKHILACVFKGDLEEMRKAYWIMVDQQSGKLPRHGFKVGLTFTNRDIALYEWMNIIVDKNLPISAIEDYDMRAFSRFPDVRLSSETLKATMFKMVEMIEKVIGEEMKEAALGAVMYDGWSQAGTHFIGMIATYMKNIANVKKGGFIDYTKELRIALLPVAPMAQHPDNPGPEHDEASPPEEAVTFDAKTTGAHFENILSYYDCGLDWPVCFIADNASVNRKTAELAKKPHIGCKNHKLNLEVNLMVKTDTQLGEAIEHLQELMKKLKTLKNADALRAVTVLKPILYNLTLWNGRRSVVQTFLRLRPYLQEVAADASNDFELPEEVATINFRNRAQKYKKYLIQIDIVSKELQTCGIKLSEAQFLLDSLVECIEEAQNEVGERAERNCFSTCRLGKMYIGKDSEKIVSKNFHG